MMKINKTLSLISPLFLAFILLAIKTSQGIYANPSDLNLIRFYFVDNLELSISVGLILVQSVIAFIIFISENQQSISGKWDVRYTSLNWKGKKSPGVIGHGRMYLAKSPYSDTDFSGYLHVTFINQANKVLHKGVYEIHFSLQKHKISGQSLMVWGEGYGEEYKKGDSDTPYVRPSLYELEYSKDKQRISGNSKMAGSPSHEIFEAFKA